MPYVCSSVHPPWDGDHFFAVVCIKVSLCNNIALGTISIHCKLLLQKSLVISLLTIFLVFVPLQHFCFFLFFFCPGSQGSVFFLFFFSKLPHFKGAPVYKWLISPSPKQHSKPLSCEHGVCVTSRNSTWREAPTLAPRIRRRQRGYGNFPCRGVSVSQPLPLSGRCKWCKFLSCSTPVLFWCDGNPFARPITPLHQHYTFMLSALFSFLREGRLGRGVEWTLQRCIVCLLISLGMQPGNIH